MLSSRAETDDEPQEIIPESARLPVEEASTQTALAPALPTEETPIQTTSAPQLPEVTESEVTSEAVSAEEIESRVSIDHTASDDVQVSVPGNEYLPPKTYLPAKEDAPVARADVEENDEPLKIRVQLDVNESESSDTQVVELEPLSTTSAPEVAIETTTLTQILSRQYLTPLLTAQSETNVVQPSHIFTKTEGYKYKLPATSFEF